MNYNFFELKVNDDATAIECRYPLISNLVMHKVFFQNNKIKNIETKPCIYVIRRRVADDENIFSYYIGQTIDGLSRMKTHINNNGTPYDFIYCTLNNNEHDLPAYLQYIETELIKRADKIKLSNKNEKTGSKFNLPELKKEAADEFVRQFIAMAGMLDYKELFEIKQSDDKTGLNVTLNVSGIIARGVRYPDNKLLVLEGSTCKSREYDMQKTDGNAPYDRQLWELLKENNDLNDNLQFNKDTTFNSPSQAARIILGYSVNGLDYWKTDEGLSLKDHLNRE